MATKIEIEVLEDGKISVKTGRIADSVHVDADELLSELEENLGGERVTQPNEDNPGKVFWKNKQVIRGGKIITK